MFLPVKTTKSAFTLAEVLVTLAIIGVVASMTLPALLGNVNSKIYFNQAKVVAAKLTAAIETMTALEVVGPYPSTEDFVEELQKHIKITEVCPNFEVTDDNRDNFNNLSNSCWPYSKIHVGDNVIPVSIILMGTTTSSAFNMHNLDINGNSADYSSVPISFRMADGVSVILGYNLNCQNGNARNSQNCVAGIFDVNGKKNPNKVGEDVILFNANGLMGVDSTGGFECSGSVCWIDPGIIPTRPGGAPSVSSLYFTEFSTSFQ